MRKEFSVNPGSALSAAFEFKSGRDTREILLATRHGRQALAFSDTVRKRLSVDLLQPRLVVKKIDVARTTGHEEVDDAFCFWNKVRQLGKALNLWKRRRGVRLRRLAPKQLSECSGSQQGSGATEENTSLHVLGACPAQLFLHYLCLHSIHSLVSVSSRLRIMLATTVVAACSTGSSDSSRLNSPIEISFTAALESAR